MMLTLVDDRGWTDLGAVASRWGGVDGQGTCKAPNALDWNTRNDYLFLCPDAMQLLKHFKVTIDPDIDVHAVLTADFHFFNVMPSANINIVPTSMFSVLKAVFF